MRRRFRISSLALAGLTGVGATFAFPIPVAARSDDEYSNPSSLFELFREVKPFGFKQHRSHRSHSSHGSHRSSSGGSRPSPRSSPPSSAPARRVYPESQSTSPNSVLPSSGSTSSGATEREEITDIRRVQAMLAAYGYYTGNIDGVDGPLTRAAISRYQTREGLPVTGLVDDALLGSLGLTTD